MAISAINSSLSQLNRAHSASAASIQKIASGSKYPSASYGASAYAISIKLNSNIGATAQANRNTQSSNAMLNVASGAVSSTVSALSDLQSQLLSAANGTNTDTDIAALSKSVNAAIGSINENAGVTFNGQTLLDGNTTATVAGVDGYTNLNLGNMTAQGLGLADKDGNSTLDLTSQDGIKSALDTVTNALNSALSESANIGSAQQGLSYASANYTVSEENETNALSVESDTDIASEVTKLKSSQAQEQLALKAQKLYMHNNAAVLNLLQ